MVTIPVTYCAAAFAKKHSDKKTIRSPLYGIKRSVVFHNEYGITGKRLDQTTGDGDPQRGLFQIRAGKLWTGFSQNPHGFTIIAKLKPGREAAMRSYADTVEKALHADPFFLTPLKLHYLKWVLFDIGSEKYFMYQGIFDTEFDKYTDDAVALFSKSGLQTAFENLEGFPEDWKTNIPAFIKFVRDHHRPSFMEYGEYPFVTADEIKKALKVKKALGDMLDQMQ